MDARHLYESIVATTKALIVVLDVDGRIVLFNPACEDLTGYRFEEVKGRTVWDFLLTPEERDPVKAVFNDLRAGRFPKTYQNYWVTRSGALHFIKWSNTAVTDEHGRVTHVIGTGIDVTERRAAESALRESEAHFRTLAENLPLVFWARELPSKRISYVSPAYETIWGRKLADLDEAYQSFLESIHPDDREMLFRQMERETEAHEVAETEYRIFRPDRSVRWIHSRAVPVRDEAGKVCRIVGFAEDITDRKAVEDALSAARQRQKALLDAIPDSVWLADTDGRYIEANRGYGKRWGIDPTSVIGKTVFDVFPASIAASNAAEDREVLRTGKPLRIEKRRLIRDREYRLDVIKVPVMDDAGNVVGIAGISRDITDRKRAEDDMKRSRERLQLALEGARLALWDTNAESGEVFLSERWAEMLGEPQRETRTTTKELLQLVHPEDRQRVLDAAVLAMKGARPEYAEEHRVRTVTGEWCWVMSRGRVTERAANGRAARMSGTNLDITDRKHTEQELHGIQQRQKALLDSIPDIAWLKDSDGRYIAVNRLFGQAFNVDTVQIAGKSDFHIFPQATAAQFAAEDRAVMASGEPWRHEELLSRAGGQKWMETIKVAIKNDMGEIVGIAGTSRDITERKLAEAQRMARDAALRAAFGKEVRHRIKNSLQGVVTLVERLASKHPEHESLWEAVIARVNTIAAVHGLHSSTGERELRLDQIILRLVSSLKNLHGDLPVQLSIRSDSANVWVTESEIVPLALIVNELIMNAIKHSRGGKDNKPIDVALEGTGDCARFTVSNHTGRLPPQFDFDTGGGLGTGLTLVKSLLPVDGALLRFENTEGPTGVKVELTLRPPVITSVASST